MIRTAFILAAATAILSCSGPSARPATTAAPTSARPSGRAEAEQNLRQIFREAAAYYSSEHYDVQQTMHTNCTVASHGDLDGDGTQSTFEMAVGSDANGDMFRAPDLTITNETE